MSGIIVRDLITGKLERHSAHAVLLCTGGYGNVFYLSTNAMGCNVTAIWKAHKKVLIGNPCFTQIHPTCIPVTGDHQSKLTLMSESLRNDGRIWVPKKQGDIRKPNEIPEDERGLLFREKISCVRKFGTQGRSIKSRERKVRIG
jgi:succinate dehydrogenase / fumarate reductase flavoprotein subunit